MVVFQLLEVKQLHYSFHQKIEMNTLNYWKKKYRWFDFDCLEILDLWLPLTHLLFL